MLRNNIRVVRDSTKSVMILSMDCRVFDAYNDLIYNIGLPNPGERLPLIAYSNNREFNLRRWLKLVSDCGYNFADVTVCGNCMITGNCRADMMIAGYNFDAPMTVCHSCLCIRGVGLINCKCKTLCFAHPGILKICGRCPMCSYTKCTTCPNLIETGTGITKCQACCYVVQPN